MVSAIPQERLAEIVREARSRSGVPAVAAGLLVGERVELAADGPVEVTKEGQPAPKCSDLRAGNEFIREMVRVVVKPVGRGRKVPVADRVEVNCLTPASASVPTTAEVEAVAS